MRPLKPRRRRKKIASFSPSRVLWGLPDGDQWWRQRASGVMESLPRALTLRLSRTSSPRL